MILKIHHSHQLLALLKITDDVEQNDFVSSADDAESVKVIKLDKRLKLVFTDYHLYGNREGIHIDVNFVGSEWAFLIGGSHKLDMLRAGEIGVNYNNSVVRSALEEIFGDYLYADRTCSPVRCDADPKFGPLDPWLVVQGMCI